MCDYLFPNQYISLNEQREIFAIRCRMNKLSANFSNMIFDNTYCETGCGELLSNEHIFYCSQLSNGEMKTDFNNIYNGTLKQKVDTYREIKKNMEKRENIISNK